MIRIYGFDDCPWCKRAVELSHQKGVDYEYIDIPTREERLKFLDDRGCLTPGSRTLPKVYHLSSDGTETLIGGFVDLREELN